MTVSADPPRATPDIPHILVFGAGAIGQWIGARFVEAGARVTLICRAAACTAIREHGLCVTDAAGRRLDVSTVGTAESPAALAGQRFDWIFVTVKAFDVAAALQALDAAGLLSAGTCVMGFQNGVGSERTISAAVTPERTYVCVVTRPIALTDRPGQVEEASRQGGISIAPYVRGLGFGGLEPLLARCRIPVTRFEDQRTMKWSKLLLNMTANATCAILDCSAADVYRDARLFRVERTAFDEASRVMRAMGIGPANLPGYPAALLWLVMKRLPPPVARLILQRRVGSARGRKPPSLLLEMQRPRPQSEVHWLNGAVVEGARAFGLQAPANAFLTDTLDAIMRGTLPWETYRQRPDRFLADFRKAVS